MTIDCKSAYNIRRCPLRKTIQNMDQDCIPSYDNQNSQNTIDTLTAYDALQKIIDIDSGNLVEVTRCKHCRYYITSEWSSDTFKNMCWLSMSKREPEFFCAHAEKRKTEC